MAKLGKLVQKAFYLGVGLASVAADRASTEIADLRKQAQKLADELVERGEMTAQDAREFVDNFVKRQMEQGDLEGSTINVESVEEDAPRNIQIDDDDSEISPSGSSELSTPPQQTERSRSGTTSSKIDTGSENTSDASTRYSEQLRQEINDLKAELDRLRGS